MLIIPKGPEDSLNFPGLPGLVANRLNEAGRCSDEVGASLDGEVASHGDGGGEFSERVGIGGIFHCMGCFHFDGTSRKGEVSPKMTSRPGFRAGCP